LGIGYFGLIPKVIGCFVVNMNIGCPFLNIWK
jgi:hypothetical protein